MSNHELHPEIALVDMVSDRGSTQKNRLAGRPASENLA